MQTGECYFKNYKMQHNKSIIGLSHFWKKVLSKKLFLPTFILEKTNEQ